LTLAKSAKSKAVDAIEAPKALEAHPEKPLLYSSASMVQRRRRILKEARLLIAESGYENFSVRKLCARSGVAQRTLYNSFHSKDRIITLAIQDAMAEIHENSQYRTDPDTLAGFLDRAIAAQRVSLMAPNYLKAVMTIYFGNKTPDDIWESMRSITIVRIRHWLTFTDRMGELQPWVNHAHFADAMVNLQYCSLNDWSLGRVPHDEHLARLAENMLLMIVGAVRGSTRKEAEKYLTTVQKTGKPPVFAGASGT